MENVKEYSPISALRTDLPPFLPARLCEFQC
jgi:hypothetical protein